MGSPKSSNLIFVVAPSKSAHQQTAINIKAKSVIITFNYKMFSARLHADSFSFLLDLDDAVFYSRLVSAEKNEKKSERNLSTDTRLMHTEK
jgi:hypothetical protein